MANLLPTKRNLIAAKRSRTLARTGYELMDRKRNILIRYLQYMVCSVRLSLNTAQTNRKRDF